MKNISKNLALYIILIINIILLFWNFIASFIFSLFFILILLSSGGYGSPEGKWQAYTVGTGNWRIGGVAATNEQYSRALDAEIKEKRGISRGGIFLIIIIVILVISIAGMLLGYGSILNF